MFFTTGQASVWQLPQHANVLRHIHNWQRQNKMRCSQPLITNPAPVIGYKRVASSHP